jgi:septum formation protein
MTKQLILASQSPRRAELLENMGFDFETMSADADESPLPNECPIQLVSRLAHLKAQTVAEQLQDEVRSKSVILAADTLVVAKDTVLSKPTDFQDFTRMMQSLSDSTHTVMTGICVMDIQSHDSKVIESEVSFCKLARKDIENYWQTGEPQDKAGGYGIQGIGGQFVKSISGSYSSVVGLPMVETKQLLAEYGVVQ